MFCSSRLKSRGAGSILRRRGKLPERGTFSMTNTRIITKKASLKFPILLLRLLLGGGGYLNMFKGRGGYLFLKSAGIIGISFLNMCRTLGTIFEKYCKIIRREIEY